MSTAVASGFRHTVWTAQGTTPGRDRGRAAADAERAPDATVGLRAGARAEHGVRRRQAGERRGRQPPARSRPLPRLAHRRSAPSSPSATGSTRGPRSSRECTAGGRVRAAARDRDARGRREAPVAPRADRRPARWSRTSPPCCGARASTTQAIGAAAAGPGRAASTRWTAPKLHRAPERGASCSSPPTSSTSPGCARRRGASAWRPPSTRPSAAGPADDQRRDDPPPSGVGGRRPAADRLARVAPRLEARSRSRRRTGGSAAPPAGAGRTSS